MKVKILKRDCNFDSPHEIDRGNYRYKIKNVVYDPNIGRVNFDKTDSDNEPIRINERFVLKFKKLKNNEILDEYQQSELPPDFPYLYFYKRNIYEIEKNSPYTADEIKLMIKESYYKQNEKFRKLQKEIELFESSDTKIENTARGPIPEKVRFFIWRRDGGKCVICGSKEKLEFDHIIPLSRGGSSTERNIQLLCEKCNREKSAKI